MKTIFDAIFGDEMFEAFSNSLFGNVKMIGNGSDADIVNSDGKYCLPFHFTDGIKSDKLDVKVDSKNKKITVKYDDSSAHSRVRYEYTQTIPEFVDVNTAKAELSNGNKLLVTFDKKEEKKPEEKTNEIKVNFSDED